VSRFRTPDLPQLSVVRENRINVALQLDDTEIVSKISFWLLRKYHNTRRATLRPARGMTFGEGRPDTAGGDNDFKWT
jgi:hypothetical protein